ncbi:MAG: hypothetical protein HZB76_04480 [Chlamydiae bacterium]|nr:hypothetical protein [Chlamydiota bacterium]
MAASVSAPALPAQGAKVTTSTFGSKLQKIAQVIFSKYTFYAVGALLIGSALALIAMHSFVILHPSMVLLICGFGAIAIGYVVGFDNESHKVDNPLPTVRDPLADIVYGKIDDKKIESAKGKVIGIANQGNTCYIEAFLQMIINTPTIVEFLLKKPDGFQPLSDFVIQYQKDCQANRETTEADVENIRTWMIEFQTGKELNLISEDKQEDAGAELDLFDAMLLSAKENKVKKVPLVGHVNRSVVLDNGREYYGSSCKGEDLGRLSIPATENVPFTELMNRSDLNASTITNPGDPNNLKKPPSP